MSAQLYAGDVSVGTELGDLVITPSRVTLFRFSAATWNPHRIHYDAAYAATEGYPDVLVQSHLYGCWLVRLVNEWAGPRARVRELGWQNRRFAVPDQPLRCRGVVADVRERDLVECKLEVVDQEDQVCAPGRVLVQLPQREGE